MSTKIARTHDFRLDPSPYRALHSEQGVFKTPPYSTEIRDVWRIKDEAIARKSAESIFASFEKYRWVLATCHDESNN